MEYVLKILLHKLTLNTMQLVDSENRNTLQLINVLMLQSLKRMLDKFLLVKLLFFLTLVLLHKRLHCRSKKKLVKLLLLKVITLRTSYHQEVYMLPFQDKSIAMSRNSQSLLVAELQLRKEPQQLLHHQVL
jgi:hypothetical protein